MHREGRRRAALQDHPRVAAALHELPGGTVFRINPHAKRQVSALLGLRWDRWFQSASGDERAEEEPEQSPGGKYRTAIPLS